MQWIKGNDCLILLMNAVLVCSCYVGIFFTLSVVMNYLCVNLCMVQLCPASDVYRPVLFDYFTTSFSTVPCYCYCLLMIAIKYV